MSNKEIVDALKHRSDIFVERARKDSDNVLRLLKKVRRSFAVKRRRALVGPGALERVLEHVERVLEERHGGRLNKMNDMIKELLAMSNTEHQFSEINIVNDVQLRACSVNLQEEVLNEVENEFETEMNKTIIEEIVSHQQDLDKSELECDMDNTMTEVTQDNKIYMEATVEIEKINYQPLVIEPPVNTNQDDEMKIDNIQDDEMKSDNIQDDEMKSDNIQDDEMKSDNIQDDEMKSDNIRDDEMKNDNIQSDEMKNYNIQSESEETKANSENDSVKPSNYVDLNTSTLNETFHVSVSYNDSNDKIIPNVQQKTDLSNMSVTNSKASSLSISKTETRTPNTSALFKSKFHNVIKISNTSGTKPKIKVHQSSSTLKRNANDVRQKKEMIEEEKRQKLLAKFDDHDIRMKKMDELRKCALLVQSKAIHPSINDITKMTPLSKTLLKNKDNTKAMPLSSIKSSQHPPSNKPIQQSSKMNPQQLNTSKISRHNFSASKTTYQPITQHKFNNSSNLKTSNNFTNQSILTKPILKPVNKVLKTSTDKVSSTPIMKSSFILKTPSEKKSVNVLSESCRKIVINHESYSLAALDSDNSDDEVDESVPLPSWTNKSTGTLGRLSFYHLVNTDTESIFINPKLLPLSSFDVFRSYDHCVDNINNSGVWSQT